MLPKPTIRGSILVEFNRLALSLNLDPIALVKAVDIDPRHLKDPDALLPMSALMNLLENTAAVTGIDDFGIRLAGLPGLPDLGPLTLLLCGAETLRNALQTLIAFIHTHSDAAYIYLEEGQSPFLILDLMAEDSGSHRQTIEASMANITNILRWLLGESWKPDSVSFRHARPISTVHHERFFRCPIDFGLDYNGIVLRRSDLDKKVLVSSPVLRREVERYIKSLNIAPGGDFLHKITQLVTIALPTGEAKANLVALKIGIDRRTLNRKLKKFGFNYSSLLQTIRKDLAQQYLRDPSRSLSDIAGLVGFGSLSAFSNWFWRSFGSAPSMWRKSDGPELLESKLSNNPLY